MSEVDLPAVRRALHDAAFSVLRTGTREPWSIQQNEAQVRSVMSASLMGEEIPGTMPEFASRLVLPDRENLKPRVKLIMQTEEKYAKYMELMEVVDNVRSREERCAKFRATLMKHMPDLRQSISDRIFEMEMEELKLKRDVRNIVRGEDPNGPVSLESESEKLALFAATSVQPALRVVLSAALKSSGAEPTREVKSEWEMGLPRGSELVGQEAPEKKEEEEEGEEGGGGAFLHRDDAMDKLAKKLERATKAGRREAAMVKEGVTALQDKGRALVSLVENLREEVREAAHEQGFGALEERAVRKAAAVDRLKKLSKNGRDAASPAALLAAAVRRRFAMDHREEERRQKSARQLQGVVRRRLEEGMLQHARCLAALLLMALHSARCKAMRHHAKRLQAAARRRLVQRDEDEDEGEEGEDRLEEGDSEQAQVKEGEDAHGAGNDGEEAAETAND